MKSDVIKCREIIAVYPRYHAEHITAGHGQNGDTLIVKVGGAYSYLKALKSQARPCHSSGG
jgi:hypothetical protein